MAELRCCCILYESQDGSRLDMISKLSNIDEPENITAASEMKKMKKSLFLLEESTKDKTPYISMRQI